MHYHSSLIPLDIDFNDEVTIPFMDESVPGGDGEYAEDSWQNLKLPKAYVKGIAEPLGYRVSGNSMYPLIGPGDWVILDISEQARLNPQNGDIVVALLDGKRTLKYIKFVGEEIWLCPANPDQTLYRDRQILKSDDFDVRGIVKRMVRNF